VESIAYSPLATSFGFDYTRYDPAAGQAHLVPIDIAGDLPEVRARIQNVATEIDHVGISPTGLRAVFEAHGEILTVPAKKGPTRDITNTPGVMERSPAWSPDGQLIAHFSDELGLYAVHIASQTGSGTVRKFPLAKEATSYFDPVWSPDSKLLAFRDNRLNVDARYRQRQAHTGWREGFLFQRQA
jgi:tricorn protease